MRLNRSALVVILLVILTTLSLALPAFGFGGTISIEQKGPDPVPGGKAAVEGKVKNDDGDLKCIEGRQVRVQRRHGNEDLFRTILTTSTDSDGQYSASFVAKHTRQYRAVAVAAPGCGKQSSGAIKIRVQKEGAATLSGVIAAWLRVLRGARLSPGSWSFSIASPFGR